MSTEAETLQELLTEAHGVIKDLRAQTRVTKLVIEELQAVVHAQVTRDMAAQIDTVVKEELADYHAAMMKAIAETEAAIQGRFDRIARIMLGETKTAIRQGETLEDSAAKIRQIIEDRGF